MKEQIGKYIKRYADFNKSELDKFYSKLQLQQLGEKEFVIKEGQVCNYNYFIIKGLVRSFYIDKDGNEKISFFALENWWFTSMESYAMQIPSLYSIQTIESTTVLKISKTDLDNLFESIPKFERLFRLIAQNMLIAIQRKTDIYQQMKSKERYEHFRNHFPDFLQLVPQYMIASYLEITPEYLSSLRKNTSEIIS